MPTYEYLCTSCQNAWEEIQKISEKPIEVCPSCGKSTAKRQISGGNFILKGGGWYADLDASSKPKAKADADANGKSEPKGETKGGEGAKTETKSEAKTESKPAPPKPASGAGDG